MPEQEQHQGGERIYRLLSFVPLNFGGGGAVLQQKKLAVRASRLHGSQKATVRLYPLFPPSRAHCSWARRRWGVLPSAEGRAQQP